MFAARRGPARGRPRGEAGGGPARLQRPTPAPPPQPARPPGVAGAQAARDTHPGSGRGSCAGALGGPGPGGSWLPTARAAAARRLPPPQKGNKDELKRRRGRAAGPLMEMGGPARHKGGRGTSRPPAPREAPGVLGKGRQWGRGRGCRSLQTAVCGALDSQARGSGAGLERAPGPSGEGAGSRGRALVGPPIPGPGPRPRTHCWGRRGVAVRRAGVRRLRLPAGAPHSLASSQLPGRPDPRPPTFSPPATRREPLLTPKLGGAGVLGQSRAEPPRRVNYSWGARACSQDLLCPQLLRRSGEKAGEKFAEQSWPHFSFSQLCWVLRPLSTYSPHSGFADQQGKQQEDRQPQCSVVHAEVAWIGNSYV
ncbi:uncharacterized protein LOC109438254 [Rhinolophus sinicus]|uniref:uncharacterized protein LOC109438254 n=1 Tax=Rhinolophus sinicus TaxID=89399 RepID=UPI003D798B69